MERRKIAEVGCSLAILLFAALPSLASAANNDPFRGGREAVNPKQSAGVGQSTGAMTYSYPFTIPPGRNGVQPGKRGHFNSNLNCNKVLLAHRR